MRSAARNPRHVRPGKNPGIPCGRTLSDTNDLLAGLHRTVPNQAGCDRPSSCGSGETSLVTRSTGRIAPQTTVAFGFDAFKICRSESHYRRHAAHSADACSSSSPLSQGPISAEISAPKLRRIGADVRRAFRQVVEGFLIDIPLVPIPRRTKGIGASMRALAGL